MSKFLRPHGPAAGEAHLWWVHVEALEDPELEAQCRALLLPHEVQAMERFVFLHSRQEYLLTRALCRRALSHYAPVAPMAWEFARNGHGRPDIAAPPLTPPLGFNLSNTRGMAVCLVAQDIALGVDVEWTGRPRGLRDLARNVFAPPELEDFLACPAPLQPQRFYCYWTLKEAYIKAKGVGLTLGLENFSLDLQGEAIAVRFHNGFPDAPADWQFALVEPRPDYQAAVALRRGARADLRVCAFNGMPPVR